MPQTKSCKLFLVSGHVNVFKNKLLIQNTTSRVLTIKMKVSLNMLYFAIISFKASTTLVDFYKIQNFSIYHFACNDLSIISVVMVDMVE